MRNQPRQRGGEPRLGRRGFLLGAGLVAGAWFLARWWGRGVAPAGAGPRQGVEMEKPKPADIPDGPPALDRRRPRRIATATFALG